MSLLLNLLLLGAVSGHITMTPNYGGESGSYFFSQIKVAHGAEGKYTTKVNLIVPAGVLNVVAESKPGWDITYTFRDIEAYMSHGFEVSSAVATVTWTAVCKGDNDDEAPLTCDSSTYGGLANDEMVLFSIQVQLGCQFASSVDDIDATLWTVSK
jgi:uncharacterized protein YcnI